MRLFSRGEKKPSVKILQLFSWLQRQTCLTLVSLMKELSFTEALIKSSKWAWQHSKQAFRWRKKKRGIEMTTFLRCAEVAYCDWCVAICLCWCVIGFLRDLLSHGVILGTFKPKPIGNTLGNAGCCCCCFLFFFVPTNDIPVCARFDTMSHISLTDLICKPFSIACKK